MKQYALIAKLFQYPEKDFGRDIKNNCTNLIANYPSVENLLSDFELLFKSKPLQVMQEYHVKTFEVKALCVLEVGYVLFGEDYKRGEFLVNIQKEHNNAKNDCGSELGDYLPNILSLLPKINNQEFAEELAYTLLIPAVKQMINKFLDKENMYLNVLKALLTILEKDFAHLTYEQFKIPEVSTQDFFRKQGGCNPGLCKPQKMKF